MRCATDTSQTCNQRSQLSSPTFPSSVFVLVCVLFGVGVIMSQPTVAVAYPLAMTDGEGMHSDEPSVKIVLPSGLHLRSAPDLLSRSLGVVPRGQMICVMETQRRWHVVRAQVGGETIQGYMAQGFLGDPPGPVSRQVERELCG